MREIDSCEVKTIHAGKVNACMEKMPELELINDLADIFKSIGDPTRLKIVLALSLDELCVCDIAAICNLSESATSHQLRILRHLKVVRFRREGKVVYYRLDDEHIRTLISMGLEHIREPG